MTTQRSRPNQMTEAADKKLGGELVENGSHSTRDAASPAIANRLAFASHSAIQQLAPEVRWSISTKQAVETTNRATGQRYTLPAKTPLDLRALLDGNLRGAWAMDERCLMSLDELESTFEAPNLAFYLSAQIDEVVVIDIEPSCPPGLARELMELPWLYGERSMSGLGYHLLMPLPANWHEFPVAARKKALREEHGWFEVLQDHWVTFTRDAMMRTGSQVTAARTWEEVWAGLAHTAKPSVRTEVDVEAVMPELPFAEHIVQVVAQRPYGKTVADFHGDYSRWEYGYMGHLHNVLNALLGARLMARARRWTHSDVAWLLYSAAMQALPPRKKHMEQRGGVPYLQYIAMRTVSARAAEREFSQLE